MTRTKRCELGLQRNAYEIFIHRNVTSRTSWKVLFYGTDDFSVESLKALHRNWLCDQPRIIEHLEVVTVALKNVPLEVRKFAKENNLSLYDWPYCPKKNEFDLGIVVSFGYLIPKEIIQSFPYGVLNVHASLLPRWRGAAPIFHSLLNGDRETGVTIMQIEPHKFDTGKILAQKRYAITDDADALLLRRDLAKLGASSLIESLGSLNELILNGKVQDESLATKAPKPKPEMGVIQWPVHTCQYITRLYKAFFDTPLQTVWRGQSVKLSGMLQASEVVKINLTKLEEEIKLKAGMVRPGKVVYHKKRKIILVVCKDGWVGFQYVLHKGKRPMSASEFYNGYISKVEENQSYFE
ncbi:hypothetical protein CHUAL_000866 [Chamberlinius hualienensis]